MAYQCCGDRTTLGRPIRAFQSWDSGLFLAWLLFGESCAVVLRFLSRMSRAAGFRILFWNPVILSDETKAHVPGVTAFSPAGCVGGASLPV